MDVKERLLVIVDKRNFNTGYFVKTTEYYYGYNQGYYDAIQMVLSLMSKGETE